MNILENEIEDLVWHALTTNPKLLQERGLYLYDQYTYVRQLHIGEYGRADIVGFNTYKNPYGEGRVIHVKVIELKKDVIDLNTFMQAARYAKGIKRKLELQGLDHTINVEIVLVGKTICTNTDFVYLADIIDGTRFYTYSADLEKGIRFKGHSEYKLKNEGFKSDSKDIFQILKTHVKRRLKNQWEYLDSINPESSPF